MPKITEIIPSNLPDWAIKDMADGQLFNRMIQRAEKFEEALTLFRRISERGLKQALNNLDSGNVDVYQHMLDEIERLRNENCI